ncbi:hypothetical protein SYNPS1DRAFT_29017 [Syncephalis pseudoplumigaleata]|uniref:Uncharacterized protein n=1 Tax=Syncephalis pseudoplumigaleata TaxID=1712513 RepID=A0A4P9Z0L7_9FUNG|nr:hypothetical protein SYNPS1DRAFT_29017 [Syncephalis pseudoplumigaleata]|eukprot:RKP25241.1 hypothetical protein SYNPS1DRAFT_29017 [Syncephalis pseudoplumigaleata]
MGSKWIGKPRHLVSGTITRYTPPPSDDSDKEARSNRKSPKADGSQVLATFSGSWQGSIEYSKAGEKKQPLVDLSVLRPVAKIVRPLEEQSEHESRKIWHEVSSNIIEKNFAAANRAKHTIEEHQRRLAHERRNNERVAYTSVYFDVPEVGIPVLKRQPEQY